MYRRSMLQASSQSVTRIPIAFPVINMSLYTYSKIKELPLVSQLNQRKYIAGKTHCQDRLLILMQHNIQYLFICFLHSLCSQDPDISQGLINSI